MTTFQRLLALIAPFRRWVALAVLLSFVTVTSSVALVGTSAYLISRAAVVAEVAQVSIAITCVRVFAIMRGASRYLERLVSHRATFRVLAHLRAWFFERVEPLAPAGLDQHRSGDLLARSIADIETLGGFYVRVLVPPVAAAMVVASVCIVLAVFALPLAAVLLVLLLGAGLGLPLTARKLGAAAAAQLVRTRAELNSMLVDQVQGLPDLLVFDPDGTQRHRAGQLAARLARLEARLGLLRGASSGVSAGLASLALVAVLFLAIPLVTEGRIDAVYLALLPLAALASFEAVQPLAPALHQLGASQESGRRIFSLVDAPSAVGEPEQPAPLPPELDIEFREVSFRYELGDHLALDRVSFRVPMGTSLAITGPSGSGKSTVVSLVLRFWEYDDGDILLGGRSLREYAADDLRSLIAVVPENPYLFNTTLRDNLQLANPDASEEQVRHACRVALLDDFVAGLPAGYDTFVGENGVRLSAGERQRVAIARAVLKDAPIVILDEPTANLDAGTEERLVRSLVPFLAGRTVLIISHRVAPTSLAGAVLRCDGGRILPATRSRRRSADARQSSGSNLTRPGAASTL